MFVILVYGSSCNYYVGRSSRQYEFCGVMSKAEAMVFESEAGARAVGAKLWSDGRISHWEVREVDRACAR